MATSGVPLWSTTAASNSTADPAANWAEGMAPSAVNDSARALMASVAKWRDDLYGITTGGTSTAFTVTTGSTFATAAAMSGAIFTIIPHTTSGAAPTLAPDSLTALALNVSTGVAVPEGALILGTPYLVKYVHASTEFIVLGALNKSLLTALDIINGTQLTSIATDDTLPIYDLSATANRRILVSDALKVINALTADATPDGATDYVMSYDASASAAKKVLLNNLPKSAPPPGSFKNLSIKVASNTTVTVAADFVTTTDGTNFKTTAVSSTVNLGTTGVDALDTGTIAINSWYYIWVIVQSDGTTKCVASLQSTANATFLSNLAAIASGVYTYYARIGAVQTINGSATLYGTWQLGRKAQYVVGLAQTTIPPNMVNGVASSTYAAASPTLVAVSTTRFVPTTASEISLLALSNWKNAGASNILIAPSTAYGGIQNGPTGSNGMSYPVNYGVTTMAVPVSMLLEAASFGYAADGAGGAVSCLGWVDNI